MKKSVIDALMEDGEIPEFGKVNEEDQRPTPKFDIEELMESNSFAVRVVDFLILLTAIAIILILLEII